MPEIPPIPISLTLGELQSFIEIPFTADSPLFAIEFQAMTFDTAEGPVSGYAAKVQDQTKRVWLYHEPHLPIDEEWFATDPAYSLAELAELIPTTFDELEYEVTARTTRLRARFDDVNGRTVTASIDASERRAAPPMFTPTPPGVDPANLRLLYMTGFRFLPADAAISFSMDGNLLTPALLRLPGLPLDIKRLSSTRVCTGLTLAAVNCRNAPVGASEVQNAHGWFRASGGPTAGPMSGSGTFRIDMPLGTATTGTWLLRSGSGGSPGYFAELGKVSQNWRPPALRPLDTATWLVRKLRRRNERWRWSGRFERDRTAPAGWRQSGEWRY